MQSLAQRFKILADFVIIIIIIISKEQLSPRAGAHAYDYILETSRQRTFLAFLIVDGRVQVPFLGIVC